MPVTAQVHTKWKKQYEMKVNTVIRLKTIPIGIQKSDWKISMLVTALLHI